MCGIAGILNVEEHEDIRNAAVLRMCNSMQKRGPDAAGYWSDPRAGISLGHRRLSIIDLDTSSDQPMTLNDNHLTIVFNGEIYNFLQLRRSLESQGEIFQTKSDTEVLLKLYRRDGENMLSKLRGMFSLAVWDKTIRSLFIARDPYGIKPLYIARTKGGWLFASQVKALLCSGMIDDTPDPIGQMGFWLLGSVPEPNTWFKYIKALPAGTWCKLEQDGTCSGPNIYWNIAETWREAPECRATKSEVQEIVREAVVESVRHHLVADVPVGIFLSGGIDSGSIAGLMRDRDKRYIKGVTIAFNEFKGRDEDEVPAASAIAKLYGIEHHVRVITRKEFENDLPKILSSMDQPSIDGINTWFASKAAAEIGLKVVISGVGGDELFYGYPSFRQLPKLVHRWQMLTCIPGIKKFAKFALEHKARRSGNARWRWLASQADNLYGAYWLRRGLFAPDELGDLMGPDLYNKVLHEIDPSIMLASMVGDLALDPIAAVGQMESTCYLRNQLLKDSDWASMSHSVELRTPLVDPWLLRDLTPVIRSFGRVIGKSMLAKSPEQPLTNEIISRLKTGFGVPVGIWQTDQIASSSSEVRYSTAQGGNDSRGWAKVVAKEVYK